MKQTLGDAKGLDKQLNTLLTYFQVETLLLMNRIFYHGVLLAKDEDDFTFEEFTRMYNSTRSSKHLSQKMYLLFVFAGFIDGASLESIERIFKLSGVKDLLPKATLRSILFRVLKKEGQLTKSDIAESIERGLEDRDFRNAVETLFK